MDDLKDSRRGAVVAIALLAVLVAAAWFAYQAVLGNAGNGVGSQLASAGSTRGDGSWSNPALSSVTVVDSDGYPITMGVLIDGKAAIVNVWATWCPYCVDEMQDYQALYDKYGDKVQFIMLDSAESEQEIEDARGYVKENGFTFPVFYDTNYELQEFFSVAAYPTTIVIDSSGEVLSNKPGRIVALSFDEALANLID